MAEEKDEAFPITVAKTVSNTLQVYPSLNLVTVETFKRLPEDSPIYGLVGQVASDWAYLEHVLDLIIWELAGIKQSVGACLTAQMMGHVPRCEAIIALATHRGLDPSIVERADRLKNSLFQVSTPRNRVVHDPWILISTTNSRGHFHEPGQFKSMARKELRFGASKAEIDDIQDLIAKIREKIKDCSDFRNAVSDALKALQERRP